MPSWTAPREVTYPAGDNPQVPKGDGPESVASYIAHAHVEAGLHAGSSLDPEPPKLDEQQLRTWIQQAIVIPGETL